MPGFAGSRGIARVTIAPSIRKQGRSQKDKQRMREEESIVYGEGNPSTVLVSCAKELPALL